MARRPYRSLGVNSTGVRRRSVTILLYLLVPAAYLAAATFEWKRFAPGIRAPAAHVGTIAGWAMYSALLGMVAFSIDMGVTRPPLCRISLI